VTRLPRLLSAAFLCCAAIAIAADAPPPEAATSSPAPAAPLSQNVTINLINRLVQRGLLPQSDADELIKQAEADAAQAKAQATAPAAGNPAAGAAPAPDGTVRVTYVPEVVKDQIRDELKAELMAQARAEHWADPNAVPDWVTRFHLIGDIRVRLQGMLYPSGNDDTGAFPNFNAINTGAPFDVSGSVFSPQLNVNQNRDLLRLRARLGTEVDLGEGFTAGFRLATGNDDQPVSENQTLGAANSGQGGNFAKYAIWLDRGFVRYQYGEPDQNVTLLLGRFDNPFFSTTLIWADDLGFDGLAAKIRTEVSDGVTPFLTLGVFPVFDTDLNFATIQPDKFKSTDKWLFAAQTGADVKVTKEVNVKFGVAFYDFENISGRLSDPFTPLTSSDQGDTDDLRPSFAQNGNTYMALRDIVPSALNDFGTIDQYQYFGLASGFRELALTTRVDFSRYDPFHVWFNGEFVQNLAFDRAAVSAIAVNNLGSGAPGTYQGGPTGILFNLNVGSAALEKRGDWNAGLGWRRVESDAVVDGFCDSDFNNGGTNVQGYTLQGNYALSRRVSLGLRWMAATQIAGPPLRDDIIFFDLNAKF
jgi:hypothetical protein